MFKTVLKCEKHPKADRLLVFQIDFGNEVRQIVSGIAKFYKPEELVGKQIVAVTNLAPTTIRGVESNGMILSCDGGKKSLCVISPEKQMKNGSKVC